MHKHTWTKIACAICIVYFGKQIVKESIFKTQAHEHAIEDKIVGY